MKLLYLKQNVRGEKVLPCFLDPKIIIQYLVGLYLLKKNIIKDSIKD
jgi:hypothetical protein